MTAPGRPIFVFGSNLAGYHGAGSARAAIDHHGARWGLGEGFAGNSYAIPTKDRSLRTLPLATIERAVRRFIEAALLRPDDTFTVVAIGCGLAGFRPEQIAPFFAGSPPNVKLPAEFVAALSSARAEEGT